MKPYTFYLHDTGRTTPSFDFVHCRDDDEAVLHARELLVRFAEYKLIEIYDGASTRLTVGRDGRPMPAPAAAADAA